MSLIGSIFLSGQVVESISVFSQNRNGNFFRAVEKIKAAELGFNAALYALLVLESGLFFQADAERLEKTYPITSVGLVAFGPISLVLMGIAATRFGIKPSLDAYFRQRVELHDLNDETVKLEWGRPKYQKDLQGLYLFQVVAVIALTFLSGSLVYAVASLFATHNLLTNYKWQWIKCSQTFDNPKAPTILSEKGFSEVKPLSLTISFFYTPSFGCPKHPINLSKIEEVRAHFIDKVDCFYDSLAYRNGRRVVYKGVDLKSDYIFTFCKKIPQCIKDECKGNFPLHIEVELTYKMGSLQQTWPVRLVYTPNQDPVLKL